MTLGGILSLFDNIKEQELKEEIARHYRCNVKTFRNYFETIRVLRNHCAHGTCIYNMTLPRGIIGKGPAGKFIGEDRHNVNGAIRVVKYILGIISQNRLNDLNDELNNLLSKKRNELVNHAIHECSGLK